MNMKYLWLILVWSMPVRGQDSYEIKYSVKFDQNYNKAERSYRNHEGVLKIHDGKSSFDLIALEKFTQKENDLGSIVYDTTFKIVIDQKNNLLLSKEFYFGKGMTWVIDSLFPMQWKIDTAQKKVGNYNCIRATCFFRGRNYIAWFTPEIPLSLGPWKMGGLPGLIVELEDVERYFVVELKKMSNSSSLIALPVAKYEWTKFYKDQVKFLTNLKGSLESKNATDCLSCEATTKVNITLWETL